MTSYIAFEAPAWLWILSCFALLVAGVAFGAVAAYAFRIARALDRIDDYANITAKRTDVERELGTVHERIRRLEAPEPIPVRLDAPATIRDAQPIELPAEGDTLPPVPWYTHVAP